MKHMEEETGGSMLRIWLRCYNLRDCVKSQKNWQGGGIEKWQDYWGENGEI